MYICTEFNPDPSDVTKGHRELLHGAAGVGVVLGQLQDVTLDGFDVVLQLQLSLLHALLAGLDVVDDAGHSFQQRQDGQGADGVPGLILNPDDLQLLLDARCAILVLIHCTVSTSQTLNFRKLLKRRGLVWGGGPELLGLPAGRLESGNTQPLRPKLRSGDRGEGKLHLPLLKKASGSKGNLNSGLMWTGARLKLY
ncbi:hypothetical protein INR49_007939 [Caranx melampygus]|nr:hypothetical protein INR49_007939 [Caranx melampygus]